MYNTTYCGILINVFIDNVFCETIVTFRSEFFMPTTRIKLDPDFIDSVKQEVKPHWGELGWVTYKRTYARWLPDQNRAENWDETVSLSLRFSCYSVWS